MHISCRSCKRRDDGRYDEPFAYDGCDFDGQLSFTKPDGETVVCAVTRGMLDISGGNATALCGEIILPDEIDEEREMRFVEKASERLKRRQSHNDYLMSKLSLADAMSNLEVKRRNAARNALK